MCSIPRAKKDQLASLTTIPFTSNLGRYLGFPLFHDRVKKSDFHFLLEKVQTKLSAWKSRLLNKASRTTLARSVLASIPVYTMQNVWVLYSICSTLDASVRRFIWKNNNDGRGIHLVNWNTVSSPKQYGGLGVREARISNTALLGKLVWNLMHNSNKLWVEVLAHKYLGKASILSCAPKQNASSTWRSIQKTAIILKDGFAFRLG